ncbi:hypothetical protein, partial [Tritonibacter mobilis]|uniref:hypothetical protein n=1 Tax=Tritonibacter mobilis TaxID=379347 RepID=UPI0019550CF8
PRNAKAPAGFPWAQSVMMHIYWHAGDSSVKGGSGGLIFNSRLIESGCCISAVKRILALLRLSDHLWLAYVSSLRISAPVKTVSVGRLGSTFADLSQFRGQIF